MLELGLLYGPLSKRGELDADYAISLCVEANPYLALFSCY
jgi:hypothetical protein